MEAPPMDQEAITRVEWAIARLDDAEARVRESAEDVRQALRIEDLGSTVRDRAGSALASLEDVGDELAVALRKARTRLAWLREA